MDEGGCTLESAPSEVSLGPPPRAKQAQPSNPGAKEAFMLSVTRRACPFHITPKKPQCPSPGAF